MNLIEITYPEGRLDVEARADIAAQVTALMTGGEDIPAPEETMKRARAMTHVVFHPAQNWTTGDGPLPGDQRSPYLVTVTVPDAWRNDISTHVVGGIHAVLVQHDPAQGSEPVGGDIWVNVIGVRDGSIGLNGRPATADDVLMHMTEEYRASSARHDLPEGIGADPICGMHVELGPDALTLDHDGEIVGFCSKGCRSIYARHHGIGAASA